MLVAIYMYARIHSKVTVEMRNCECDLVCNSLCQLLLLYCIYVCKYTHSKVTVEMRNCECDLCVHHYEVTVAN